MPLTDDQLHRYFDDPLQGLYAPDDPTARALAQRITHDILEAAAAAGNPGSGGTANTKVANAVINSDTLTGGVVKALRKSTSALSPEEQQKLVDAQRVGISPGKGDVPYAIMMRAFQSARRSVEGVLRDQFGVTNIDDLDPRTKAFIDSAIARAVTDYVRTTRNPIIRRVFDDWSLNYAKPVGIDTGGTGREQEEILAGLAQGFSASGQPIIEEKTAKVVALLDENPALARGRTAGATGTGTPSATAVAATATTPSTQYEIVDNANVDEIEGHGKSAGLALVIPLHEIDSSVSADDTRGVIVQRWNVDTGGHDARVQQIERVREIARVKLQAIYGRAPTEAEINKAIHYESSAYQSMTNRVTAARQAADRARLSVLSVVDPGMRGQFLMPRKRGRSTFTDDDTRNRYAEMMGQVTAETVSRIHQEYEAEVNEIDRLKGVLASSAPGSTDYNNALTELRRRMQTHVTFSRADRNRVTTELDQYMADELLGTDRDTWEDPVTHRRYRIPSMAERVNEAVLDVQTRGLGAGQVNRAKVQQRGFQDVAIAAINWERNERAIGTSLSEADRRTFLTELEKQRYLHPEYNTDQLIAATGITLPPGLREHIAVVDTTYDRGRDGSGNLQMRFVLRPQHAGDLPKQMDQRVRPTAQSSLFKTAQAAMELDQKAQIDYEGIVSNVQSMALFQIYGNRGDFTNLGGIASNIKYGTSMKENRDGIESMLAAYIGNEEAGRRINELMAYLETLHAGLSSVPYTPAVGRRIEALIGNYLETNVHAAIVHSSRYKALRYAEARAIAKHQILLDAVKKYELNPFTFNNIMRGEFLSLAIRQNILLSPDPIWFIGAPLMSVAYKLAKPYMPAVRLLDQLPFGIGVESIWRKRAKELIPTFPDIFKLYSNFFVDPAERVFQTYHKSLLDYGKLLTHLWRQTEQGGQMAFNPKVLWFGLGEYLHGRLADVGIRWINGHATDPRYSVFDRFLHRFFDSILARQNRAKENDTSVDGAFRTIIQSGVTSIIAAVFSSIGALIAERVFGTVGEIPFFGQMLRDFRLGYTDYNSALMKGIMAGEGISGATVADAAHPFWFKFGQVLATIGRGMRLFDAAAFSTVAGAERAGIFGLATYFLSGGNLPLAFLIGGVRGLWFASKDFVDKTLITVDQNGTRNFSSRWVREGITSPTATPFRKFLGRTMSWMSIRPPQYTVEEFKDILSRHAREHIDPHVAKAYNAWQDMKGDIAGYQRFLLENPDTRAGLIDRVHERFDPVLNETEIRENINRFVHDPALRSEALSELGRGHANYDAWYHDPARGHAWAEHVAIDHPEAIHANIGGLLGNDAVVARALNKMDAGGFFSWMGDPVPEAHGLANKELLRHRFYDFSGSERYSDAPAVGERMADFTRHEFWRGGGRGILGHAFRPLMDFGLEKGINALGIYVILSDFGVNPLITAGVTGGYFTYSLFKEHINATVIDPLKERLFGKLKLFDLKWNDTAKAMFDGVSKGVDILWYAQLSEEAGPIHPLVEGWNNLTGGVGTMGKGIGEVFSGNEGAGLMTILQGGLQGGIGAFELAGLGFGTYAMYDILLGGIALIPGLDVIAVPLALGATALIVGADIVTGSQISRWVMDGVGFAAQKVWDFASPLLWNIISNPLSPLSFVIGGAAFGLMGGLAAFFLLTGPPGWIILVGMGIGAAAGFALYEFLNWVQPGLLEGLALMGMASFILSFLFLFKRKDPAAVLFGVMIMVFSLGAIGALAFLPGFNYASNGFGGFFNNPGCILPQNAVVTNAAAGSCTNGNQECLGTSNGCSIGNGQTISDPNHYYSMAEDIAPTYLTNEKDGTQDYPVIAPVNGTIVGSAQNVACGSDRKRGGYVELDVAPESLSNLGTNGGTTGNYALSDVVIRIYHMIPDPYILTGKDVKVTAGERLGRLATTADTGGTSSCWTGVHAHVEVVYYNQQNGGYLKAPVDYNNTSWDCPAYNALSLFSSGTNAKTCAQPNGCSYGQNFGCSIAPANGPIVTTPLPPPAGFPGTSAQCSLNSALVNEINHVAETTCVSPSLLAAELEYNTNGMGGASIYNDPNFHTQILEHSNAFLNNQLDPVMRVSGLGIFTDTLKSTSLDQNIAQCTGHTIDPLNMSLQDALYSSALILGTYKSTPTNYTPTTFVQCANVLGKTCSANDYAISDDVIKQIAQNYVCRGSQGTYASCGINEAYSVDQLYNYFKTNCFGK